MTETAPDDTADGEGQVVTDPTPVDSTTAPADVMTALGFDPGSVQALIITSTGVVAVAADYPATPTPPTDGDTQEGSTDATD